jgi:hypothetical protein
VNKWGQRRIKIGRQWVQESGLKWRGVPDQEDTGAHIKMGTELAYSGELEFVIAIWLA